MPRYVQPKVQFLEEEEEGQEEVEDALDSEMPDILNPQPLADAISSTLSIFQDGLAVSTDITEARVRL